MTHRFGPGDPGVGIADPRAPEGEVVSLPHGDVLRLRLHRGGHQHLNLQQEEHL
jgi:hypothetical protein